MQVTILMPIFNDWISSGEMLRRLDQAFASANDSVAILLVDDGSTTAPESAFGESRYLNIAKISVLKLKKNLGHQRALAIALCYIADNCAGDATLVMDCDGEDEASDAARLLHELKQNAKTSIVFAERTRRSESIIFRFGYFIYKLLHYILTGFRIRVGNFSIIPTDLMRSLTVEPMLWNHYAASVIRSRLPIATIPTGRGKRIEGKSRLNFVGLVIHGLSALACYSEIIGVRLIMASGFLLLAAFATLCVLVSIKLFTNLAIPGWTSLLLGLVIILILQVATLISNFTMQIITGRSGQPFLPARDYIWFVSEYTIIYKKIA